MIQLIKIKRAAEKNFHKFLEDGKMNERQLTHQSRENCNPKSQEKGL